MSWVKAAQTLKAEAMEELIKQLSLANIQAQTRHEVQQENTRLLVAQLAAQQATQQEVMQAQVTALKEVVQQLSQGREQAAVAPGNQVTVRASHFLQKLSLSDDVEAFLATFERTAEREGWPQDQWAGLIAPFLTGDPQKAYFDLPPDHAKDYQKLKAEILARLGVTTAVRAQRVHQWKYRPDRPPRSQMHDLVQLVKKWLQPEMLSGLQIVERVVLDRYLRSLPDDLQRWVSHGDPKTVNLLVEMVERYTVVEDLLGPTKRQGPSLPRPIRSTAALRKDVPRSPGTNTPEGQESLPIPSQRPVPVRRGGDVQCWRCHSWGHTRAHCPLQEEPMECGVLRRGSFYAHKACTTHIDLGEEKFECEVQVNHLPARALLDSGSMVTLIHPRVIGKIGPVRKTLRVVCIHGDTREYPLISVTISAACGTGTQEVGVVKNLVHDVIIGRDCPLFAKLWGQGELPERSRDWGETSPSVPAVERNNPEMPNVLENANDLVNGDESSADVIKGVKMCGSQTYLNTEEGGEPFPLQVMLGEEDEEVAVTPALPDLGVPQGAFGTAQMQDPTLAHAREQVVVLNGVPQEPGANERWPHFAICNELLYRVTKVRENVVEQLLVPQQYRRKVLDLAHDDVLGGHLGVEKTEARITDRFYWPGLKAEVRRYCTSCPTCQLTAPVTHFRNPLVPLPIIEVPFERIAMDIVGPLVKSARGHSYILVILDYATRYPEALPLRNTSSKAIARELFQLFTRTGFPKEILTDQGTPFMSRVMADVCKLFRIKQLRTSVYHPQTDGLVERFNKTLKSMLKRVVQRDGKDWDCLLPALLFAIREVPQASTGFSPFELVYGRRPRGLLDFVKEEWESEPSQHKSVLEYVSQMQERIRTVLPLVKEHLQKAQEAQRRVYNRAAKIRNFQVGDRVAVLIPTVESKFLARWQGPFEVVEKVGEVNYKIHQPGKRKPYQIYHVNLLKPWTEREPVTSLASARLEPRVGVESVQVANTLSKTQSQQAKEFLQRNKEKFSDLPGLTSTIEHDIITEPGVKVFVRPYRIPEAQRKAVSEEVKKMLDLEIIEESQSEWSSPIVLVPKPNGTLRFCNDFRKLNEVSRFDAYPMPRVDELIERLGPARYITTLDLTKGYWQIPLTKAAREKTAFSTPEGSFQYKRMPFGLQTAPATFQRAMDRILRPHQKYASVYLDDIVIFSRDWESHLPKVQAVLDSLWKEGFTINPEKCALGMEEVKYLGYIVGRGVVKPQVSKVEAIQSWPRPLTKKQVRAFLGMVGYYRRFVPNFATLAAPLTDLTKGRKSVMVEWNADAEKAFLELKSALCQHPVLVAPNFSKEFVVQTDASDVGLGAVLSQVINGEEHPVVFLSRKLTPAEKNYAIIERECLAIKWALESLRYYLLGRKFRLISDHAPLTWLRQGKGNNARVTRWFLALQEFKFVVEHRPGRLHQNADALSRVHCLSSTVASTSMALGHRGGICTGRRGWVLEGRYVSPLFGLWSL